MNKIQNGEDANGTSRGLAGANNARQDHDLGFADGQTWVEYRAEESQLMHLGQFFKAEQRLILLTAGRIGVSRYPFAFIVAAKILHGVVWESVFVRDEVFRFWE